MRQAAVTLVMQFPKRVACSRPTAFNNQSINKFVPLYFISGEGQ
jgi:hypothetical protein